MSKFIIVLFSLLLISCTGLRAGDGQKSIQVDTPKPFCDIKKVDPNCKTHKGTL